MFNFQEWLSKLFLSNESFKKVLTGALIAAAGAALTYLAEGMTSMDFGMLTPTVVAVMSVIVNYLRKLLEDLTKPAVPDKPDDNLKIV